MTSTITVKAIHARPVHHNQLIQPTCQRRGRGRGRGRGSAWGSAGCQGNRRRQRWPDGSASHLWWSAAVRSSWPHSKHTGCELWGVDSAMLTTPAAAGKSKRKTNLMSHLFFYKQSVTMWLVTGDDHVLHFCRLDRFVVDNLCSVLSYFCLCANTEHILRNRNLTNWSKIPRGQKPSALQKTFKEPSHVSNTQWAISTHFPMPAHVDTRGLADLAIWPIC